jgi:hypothetical protein
MKCLRYHSVENLYGKKIKSQTRNGFVVTAVLRTTMKTFNAGTVVLQRMDMIKAAITGELILRILAGIRFGMLTKGLCDTATIRSELRKLFLTVS